MNVRPVLATTVIGLLILGCSLQVHAETSGPAASAEQAFNAGNFNRALQGYTVLIDTHGATTDLLFNQGVAAWEAGKPGQAIWALERARLADPTDERIGVNLNTVRQRIRVARVEANDGQKLTEGESDDIFWFRLMTSFRAWIVAGAVGLLNLLTFLLLAIRRRLRPGAVRDGITVGAVTAGIALLVALGTLLGHAAVVENVQLAAVIGDSIELHQTPTSSGKTKAHPDVYSGAVLRMLEQRKDGWVQVRTADGTVGWLRGRHIGPIR